MAWVDISASTFSKYYQKNGGEYDSVVSGDVYATLQYDDTATTTTSAKLRFKLNNVGGYDYWDQYYILLYPDSSNRSLHPLKTVYTKSMNDTTARAKWPYIATTTFTVTKKFTDSKFTIPALWLINDGWDNTSPLTAAQFYKNYSKGGSRGVALRAAFNATSIPINSSKTVAKAVTAGSVQDKLISDLGNNHFSVTGNNGKAGTNNKITEARLQWATSKSNGSWVVAGSKAVKNPADSATITESSIPLTTVGTGDDREIACRVSIDDSYSNTVNSSWTTKKIKQYFKPNKPGTPTLSSDSKTGDKLTNVKNWVYTWNAANPLTPNETTSPVEGYRIYIYKNGTLIKGLKNGSTTDSIEVGTGTNEYLSRSTTSTSITFNPKGTGFGFAAGDKVKVAVSAYTIWGDKSYKPSDVAYSTETTVENAGIVRINRGLDSNGNVIWSIGQVYIKTKIGSANAMDDWSAAESIRIKTGDGNSESDWKYST